MALTSGCIDEGQGPAGKVTGPFLKAGGGPPLPDPDPDVTLTLEVLGSQPGIERSDLHLSQTVGVTEDLSGGYSSTIQHAAPQSLTGAALPVDVASGAFSFTTGFSLTDRNGSAITPPDIATLQADWAVPGSASASLRAPGALSQSLIERAAAARSFLGTGQGAGSSVGRRYRIADPITPQRANETLGRLTADYSELAQVGGRRRFRRDRGALGAVEVEFDPAIGAITKLITSRHGKIEAVVEQDYVRAGEHYRLRRLVTTTYAPDGSVRGRFVTSVEPKTASSRGGS